MPSLPSFEKMREMAQNDPQALERLRQMHINKLIHAAPEHLRQRLQGLQFQIDAQRRLSKTPMASCLQISKMMHDSLHSLGTYIKGSTGQIELPQTEQVEAKVLSFRRKDQGNL
ncbi:MAG: DUF3135 domain-containing protein [Oceanospirillaceae bacterium]|nr:DUF3135 domain-containing protein [Oceanospirillaceae bacterium]MCP5335833.1 DUF3135 domain-containing protein [Oceanospirillaceae bacterium]MCP5349645.1 DUF3135 domain-containing protein [Oceanospirillaceae bacterium]